MDSIKRAFEGRIGRLEFAGRIVYEIGVDLVAIVLVSKFVDRLWPWLQALIWAMLALLLLASVYNIPISIVRRLHDMGRYGTQAWLILIPLYNIYFFLLLLSRRGMEETDGVKPEPDIHTHKWIRLIMGTAALAIGVLMFFVM